MQWGYKMEEAEILNRLEKKARKGKATDRELRLLVEAYNMHGIMIPKEIMKQVGY